MTGNWIPAVDNDSPVYDECGDNDDVFLGLK